MQYDPHSMILTHFYHFSRIEPKMLLNLVNNYKNFVFHKGIQIKTKEKAYIDDPEKPGETWTSIEESKLVSNYQTPTVKLPSSKKSLPGGSKKSLPLSEGSE